MKRKQRKSRNAPENEKRLTLVTVRFSTDELELVDAAAAKLRAIRSDVIRDAAVAAARKVKAK